MLFPTVFWLEDYAQGVDALFGKLRQGVAENDEYIRLFAARMEIERDYGLRLVAIPDDHLPGKTGFGRDEGGSVKVSFLGIQAEFANEGRAHATVAANIHSMVVEPFLQWSEGHKSRVANSEGVLREKMRLFQRHRSDADRVSKRYFTKCRQLEEFQKALAEAGSAPLDEEESEDELLEHYTIGGVTYTGESIQAVLLEIIQQVPQMTHKVTLLGAYERCSHGSSIVSHLVLKGYTVDDAEQFGQDLVDQGFLRLVGQVGLLFVNSKKFVYQWKDEAYRLARIPHKRLTSTFDMKENLAQLQIGSQLLDRQIARRLEREVEDLDQEYRFAVLDADRSRCTLEETMMNHFAFMQRCETDRLAALKRATLDFLLVVSNKVAELKLTVDRFMVFEESILPALDLQVTIDTYHTGRFRPQPLVYENYYRSAAPFQVFGVDLELRCRTEGKMIPLVVTACLMFLDGHYAEMESDDGRIKLWTRTANLQGVHVLRAKVNQLAGEGSTPADYSAALEDATPAAVATLLKVYLLELPVPLIPAATTDLLRLLYGLEDGEEGARITGLTNLLADLPRVHIATIDALLTHLERLESIIRSASLETADRFVREAFPELSEVVLRPAVADIRLGQSVVSDLWSHKEEVFGSLKRKSSKTRKPKKSKKEVVVVDE